MGTIDSIIATPVANGNATRTGTVNMSMGVGHLRDVVERQGELTVFLIFEKLQEAFLILLAFF